MKCPVKEEELREFVIIAIIGLNDQTYRVSRKEMYDEFYEIALFIRSSETKLSIEIVRT